LPKITKLDGMSEFFSKTFYGNTVAQWSITLAYIIGGVILAKILYWFIGKVIKKATSKTKNKFDDILVDMFEEPIALIVVLVVSWFAIGKLNFNENWTNFIEHVFYILVTFSIAWLFVRLVDAIIQEYIVPLVEKSKSNLDDQILPILRKSIKISIWIIALIIGLDNAGYNVGTLLASLGIGGLALAMAAKDTVSNFFGGITIFVDKPFTIKDRINIDGIDGVVEEIGIRSTRIRNLSGRMITVPNSIFTNNKIENISSEPNRKIVLTLGLTYDNDEKNIEKAINLLKEIAQNNENTEENVYVGFTGFGDFSLNITFIYYILKGKDILQTQTEINSDILKKFSQEKLEFAFPTQTIITQS